MNPERAAKLAALLMAPVLIPVGVAFVAYGYTARAAVAVYRRARPRPAEESVRDYGKVHGAELAGLTNEDIDWLLNR